MLSRRFSAHKAGVLLCAPHTGAGGGMLLELAGACECANQWRMLSSFCMFLQQIQSISTKQPQGD